jgi:hypothetical protein
MDAKSRTRKRVDCFIAIVQPGYLPMNFYERKHEGKEEPTVLLMVSGVPLT